MKVKLKAAFWLGTLSLLGMMPQQAESRDSAKGTVFKRIAMEYLFYELTNRGVPVAYVQIPVKMSDGITVKEKIKQLQAIPEKDRDDRENEAL